MRRIPILLLLLRLTTPCSALSALFDRFQTVCPADPSAVRLFDSKLVHADNDDNDTWAVVYRSNNNKPSVVVRDEFLAAMKSAVDVATTRTDKDAMQAFESTSVKAQVPVAVARLRPSADYNDCWILDSMQCLLKKEDTDETCDGGSEFVEAIANAVDALLLQHLNRQRCFEGAIRTKSTLFNSKLLEDRGFREVESLTRDMATHVSSLDDCLERFAARSVSRSTAASERSISIVSLLGQIDRETDLQRAQQRDSAAGIADDDEYDPWATVKQFN